VSKDDAVVKLTRMSTHSSCYSDLQRHGIQCTIRDGALLIAAARLSELVVAVTNLTLHNAKRNVYAGSSCWCEIRQARRGAAGC
jgi:hypothetical protein